MTTQQSEHVDQRIKVHASDRTNSIHVPLFPAIVQSISRSHSHRCPVHDRLTMLAAMCATLRAFTERERGAMPLRVGRCGLSGSATVKWVSCCFRSDRCVVLGRLDGPVDLGSQHSFLADTGRIISILVFAASGWR